MCARARHQEDITPLDIFVALNVENRDALKMTEFRKLFDMLDLNITENQKEQMFAFCDLDCSGEITEKEFLDGCAHSPPAPPQSLR